MSITLFSCDDGFGDIKILQGDPGQRIRHTLPSRAQSGDWYQAGLGTAAEESAVYETEGGTFTVGESLQAEDTRFSDYAVSPLNRVLVAHALRHAGARAPFALAVGLPLRDYFRANGTPNEGRIAAKRQNHLTPVRLRTIDGPVDLPVPQVVHILPQSLVVAMGADIGDEEDAPVAVVDVGSRTTDITVVQQGRVDFTRCGTLPDLGVAAAIDRFQGAVEDATGQRLTRNVAQNALIHQKPIKLYGQAVAADIVNHARAKAIQAIAASMTHGVEQQARTLADCAAVILIGGGAYLFADVLPWPHARAHADPVFANADAWHTLLEAQNP
ncbi:StbA family protein [Acidithiobacillus ferrivorans SS3]|uniref:StbA family protein n=1 Tax=Acidithiobacillus ferrivorans SS3 TaxID=743299 RepID=G0JTY7_9PROT|nr:ParM/StbA family protein [Acidithiobacillus ferrivorans]AEM46739.1 StbA family protein [Acidithiobacillus ferrivorans SS3]OFA15601.1 hypothetical protein A4U49_11965 [Acidithiobacillus ferrivorans]